MKKKGICFESDYKYSGVRDKFESDDVDELEKKVALASNNQC